MTYTFTYTINYHNHQLYNGKRVVTNIDYTVACSRSDGKSCSWNTSLAFPFNAGEVVIPRSWIKYDDTDPENLVLNTYPSYSSRSDFTEYDDLSIPNDLITWVKAYHEEDAVRLEGTKGHADSLIT